MLVQQIGCARQPIVMGGPAKAIELTGFGEIAVDFFGFQETG